MATTKPAKRGFLERSRAVPAPAAETVTETRSELHRPDLSIAASNSPPVNKKVPVLPTALETEHVLEDYTEAYFNEHYEDEQLVSSKKSQFASGRDTHSNRFQSHVNPAFQHDSESRWDNQGSGSEAAEHFKSDRTKASPKEPEKQGDANNKVHSKLRPYHAHSQIPKDIHKDQGQDKVLVESRSDPSASKLDRTVTPSKNCNWQQDEVKSGQSHGRGLNVNITVGKERNDEKTRIFVDENMVADSSVVYPAASDNDDIPSPTDQRQCPDDVFVTAVTDKQSGGRGRAERPHARNLSLVTANISNDMWESGSNSVQRSRSMRLPLASDSEIHRVRKPLLRELSFSDCDSKKVRNYGCLGVSSGLPRRRQVALGLEDEDNKKHIPKFLKSELAASLLDLMQQLLARGKVRQVAVLEQANCCMLTSLPTWHLAHRDQIGLVKAATSSLETMFKISVEKEFYTCFKHGTDKIVCHSGDSVLVAQTTHSCVVVGVASDHIPGSCLYEVSELARALLDKGW